MAVITVDFRKKVIIPSLPSEKTAEEQTMIRVKTRSGFDYVKKEHLPALIEDGYVISAA